MLQLYLPVAAGKATQLDAAVVVHLLHPCRRLRCVGGGVWALPAAKPSAPAAYRPRSLYCSCRESSM